MISVSSELLQTWVNGLILPLTRVLGLIVIAPFFGHMAIPRTIKVALGIMITLAIAPTLPPMPQIDILSLSGVLIMLQQLLIGFAMGFTMRLVFSAIELAGQISGMTMGLGFASFYDPQSQGQSVATSQFFSIIAMLLFLNINGHLMLILALAESFATLPIVIEPHGLNTINLVSWAGIIFSSGLHLSLPIVAALLITNLALGILSRSAPQLNLFGIGFPITLSIGFLILALVIPRMTLPVEQLVNEGLKALDLLR